MSNSSKNSENYCSLYYNWLANCSVDIVYLGWITYCPFVLAAVLSQAHSKARLIRFTWAIIYYVLGGFGLSCCSGLVVAVKSGGLVVALRVGGLEGVEGTAVFGVDFLWNFWRLSLIYYLACLELAYYPSQTNFYVGFLHEWASLVLTWCHTPSEPHLSSLQYLQHHLSY